MFSELFALLFLFSICGLVVGLIRPLSVRRESRKSVLLFFGKAIILFFVLFCISMPSVPISDQQSIASTSNQQSQVVEGDVSETDDIPRNTIEKNSSNSNEPQVKGESVEKSIPQEAPRIVPEAIREPAQTDPAAIPAVSNSAHNTEVATNVQKNISEVVKMSNSHICHAPGTTYYDRTIHYTPYDSLEECLAAGGRLPKR